jgi:hypothetical protein
MNVNKGRKGGKKIPRKVFIIVCEGEKTEPIYFKMYKTRYSNLRIETPNSKSTDPINLTEFAKKQINKYDLDLKNGDGIWCVFDCDENTNEDITRAINIAGDEIKIILSNPNFELWFLLHFMFHVTRIDRSEVIVKLKEYIPNYKKNIDIFNMLLDKRPKAIENAKKLNKIHRKNGIELISVESNPSTQVYSVIEEILKITGESI